MPIPLIDLFAGPGGLGEGFASLKEGTAFQIVASAEMNPAARSTLRLRSFYRKVLGNSDDESSYYRFCNGEVDRPYSYRNQSAWNDADTEALQLTLGVESDNRRLDTLLSERMKRNREECVIIGGPPCQAYSLVGRSRNKGKADYRAEDDQRHFLYREYLRLVNRYSPAVFVMENVKGILSSHVGGRRIFHEILRDLVDPGKALGQSHRGRSACYRIHSLVSPTVFSRDMEPSSIDASDFVVRAEKLGIPQARHRVILVGIREDIGRGTVPLSQISSQSVQDAIGDLPPLRSQLTDERDDSNRWASIVRSSLKELSSKARRVDSALADTMRFAADRIRDNLQPGGLRVGRKRTAFITPKSLQEWFYDPRLHVVLNHHARGHMTSDLRRYAYAASFARTYGRSPKGHSEFALDGLRPDHANWESGSFSDRFRVQVWNSPSSTVTSHISKDGHYFIHPDTDQCRSLTVREAARLQTFPDNYFFQGNRTEQFHQVGNAVPPMLARAVAEQVEKLLS